MKKVLADKRLFISLALALFSTWIAVKSTFAEWESAAGFSFMVGHTVRSSNTRDIETLVLYSYEHLRSVPLWYLKSRYADDEIFLNNFGILEKEYFKISSIKIPSVEKFQPVFQENGPPHKTDFSDE